MDILTSASVIIGTFSFSTMTAYFITYLHNHPFINPKFTKEIQLERINEYIKNVPLLFIQSIGLISLASNNIIPIENHNWLESIYYISIYCIFIEANYYIYHRFIHKYYYESVHKKHHTNVNVYPFDTYYLTSIDDLASIISIGLPLFYIKLSVIEIIIILYMYITSSYLVHSELYLSHHSIHHKLLKYNYCILFPIFDIIFGTYKM
jgi:sterol desaturase/sphingolipid hydroxylase (fatty acid hydroxylase superfamily)